jgi:hypothetical protein
VNAVAGLMPARNWAAIWEKRKNRSLSDAAFVWTIGAGAEGLIVWMT